MANETTKDETTKDETTKDETRKDNGKGRPAKTFRETTPNDTATVSNVVASLPKLTPDIKVWMHPSKNPAYDVTYALTIDNVTYAAKLYITPDVSEATQRERMASLQATNERMARSLRYVGCCQSVAFSQFASGRVGYIVNADGSKTADFMGIEAVRAALCAAGIDANGNPDDCLTPITIGDYVYTYSRSESLGFTVAPVVK